MKTTAGYKTIGYSQGFLCCFVLFLFFFKLDINDRLQTFSNEPKS